MKVLHLNAGNLFGGVETLLLTLGQHASSAQAEHSFAVSFEGRFSQRLRASGLTVFKLPETRVSRPWSMLRARRELRALLQRELFDVAVCHMPWSLGIFGPECRKAGSALVFWAHDIHRGRHWLERWAGWTRPDLCIANSRITGAALRHIFPGVDPRVIHCPVAIVPPLSSESRMAVRRQFGVETDKKVIIQVSRMEPWKGQHLHLEALSLLTDRTDWTCWIVGGAQRPQEREYSNELQAKAVRLGIGDRVRFLGQRTDVHQLLGSADIYCQPNAAPEPFGISFVEALGAGLPVVSFAMGGASEIVNRDCGLLSEPGDIPALTDHLRLLLDSSDLRRKLGCNGSERARSGFDPALQSRKLDEAWSESITRRQLENAVLHRHRHVA